MVRNNDKSNDTNQMTLMSADGDVRMYSSVLLMAL